MHLIVADLDECNTHTYTCDVNADCVNTVGSYSCNCRAGYTGSGQTCNGKKLTKEYPDDFSKRWLAKTMQFYTVLFIADNNKISSASTG